MNGIDASDHYDISAFEGQTPSLLTVVIDTNPRAWAALKSVLPISKAIANILVFINAHLAFGNENQVAVLAAHTNRAAWLYPRPRRGEKKTEPSKAKTAGGGGDGGGSDGSSANKYPQFAQIESSILSSLNELINSTTPADVEPTTTLIAGALTLALAHINKASLALAPTKTSSSADPANPVVSDSGPDANRPTLHARILVISASDSAAAQYIATMNAVFAASHARIPVDTLSLRGSPTFLQQAAYITGGNFLSAASNPRALLSYLMFGFLADAQARRALVSPSQDTVDFRAACFCHRRVVDTGFVCSVCLSIFCEVPESSSQPELQENGQPQQQQEGGSVECLTCGTPLALGHYGAKPAVVPRKKPKRKKNARANGTSVGPDTGSAAGTPAP